MKIKDMPLMWAEHALDEAVGNFNRLANDQETWKNIKGFTELLKMREDMVYLAKQCVETIKNK
jgi:hypothetical protein